MANSVQSTVPVVLYLRVSTQKQGSTGHGIQAQERDINIFLTSHPDHEVIGKFVEVESGANSDRKELEKALNLCRHKSSILLVQKVDRLSRDVEFIAKLLKEKNLKLRVANLPNADNFQIHLFAALGQQEREFISQRTKAAMKSAKERGVVLGNPRLSEINRIRSKKANKTDQLILPVITPLREKGMTFQEITEVVNQMGFRTPTGCEFFPSTIHRIMKRNKAS
jgi:DNA invertase Pin-like site-specific DNA recombinase